MKKSVRRLHVRTILREKQGGKCCYCGVKMTPPVNRTKRRGQPATMETLEHLCRLADGGGNRRDNLALACYSCNNGRGSLDWLTYKSLKMGEMEMDA